ncbi:sulfatase [Natronosalvus halobius]|uniref:sulfatase n=1 Tax=Natronosalvus halobius TaxID=2953746 RepID=UPI0020A1B99F|nr:sulfatase [Natronosalvus halobius]USZ71470.1 sulfatase [Natronosalvus halobius]
MAKPNVLWISLESVRADYTSLGQSNDTPTPNIKRIASTDEGRYFSNCYAHAHWTPASTTSILTGTYPSSHGVGYKSGKNITKVPRDLSTVPQLLDGQGYQTALFGGNTYVSSATGLDRGFDQCDTTSETDLFSLRGMKAFYQYIKNVRYNGIGLRTDIPTHGDSFREWHQFIGLRDWIKSCTESEMPYFGYVHINNSHHPYRPPNAVLRHTISDNDITISEVRKHSNKFSDGIMDLIANNSTLNANQRRAVLAAYEAEIRYDDYFIGKIFNYVRSQKNTIIVITGDHGELFGEKGVFGHNLILHDKLLHVPMVVYGLDLETVSDDALMQHMDVMQTILNTIGVDTTQFQGFDLNSQKRDFVIAERGPRPEDIDNLKKINSQIDDRRFHRTGVACLRSKEWKYQKSTDREELFRLPDETTDLSSEFPGKRDELEKALDERLPTDKFESSVKAEFTEQMKDQLRDMGYLD